MAEINYTKFIGLTSFTSDATEDFMKGDLSSSGFVLTPAQRAYLQARGIPVDRGVIVPKQVHGDVIWQVSADDVSQAGIFEADAVVTNVVSLPIAIRTADCLPALMYDPVKRVIAAVHAGWKSTKLDIARKTVEFMQARYGVDPINIRVAIGPCIRCDSCEVGIEFKDYFPQETFQASSGLRFDIARANLRQMTGAGIKLENIFDCGLDSFTDKVRFHSFRRDADKSGRMISIIMM
ncbi:MAG: laccase domain-containing protein [Candidatus Omnitrophica bacterium]|nr:laccase domain-containing protein [Candidatus Omnitrophota bacterium]